MAKAKTALDNSTLADNSSSVEKVEETVVETKQPSMQDMMAMFAQMQNTINELQAQLASKEKETVVKNVEEPKEVVCAAKTAFAESSDKTAEILEYLINKKSEREVVLVHNREMIGGLSTSIKLTGLNIDFHTLGEQRVLSWQQAEECVSKYYEWFKQGIILLGEDCEDLAERYNVPYFSNNKGHLTKKDVLNLHNKTDRELEDFVLSLSDEDKAFVYSYWLGKCYENDPRYVNRSKVELLNRLSETGAFDNYLTSLNFSSITNRTK